MERPRFDRNKDEEPTGPERERMDPGEIDLTGVVPQDDALADAIGDAIHEAQETGSEVPAWAAWTLARALANERNDPFSGALHHFAVTGKADPEAMTRELADLYQATTDERIREWINWLGTYVIRLADEPTSQAAESDHDTELPDAPDIGKSPEEFKAAMQRAFAEADARGEAITAETARDLARLLAIFLDPDSEMARFADTGDGHPVRLSQECQTVRQLTEHTPGASEWITRFEQHLAHRGDLGRQAQDVDRIQPDANADVTPPPPEDDILDHYPVHGTPLDRVRHYFRHVLATADARGESIEPGDAQAIATVLADKLPDGSEMRRFAETGEGDPARIAEECQSLLRRDWNIPDIPTWIRHLERHLTSRSDGGGLAESPPNPTRSTETGGAPPNPAIERSGPERTDTLPPAVADALAHAERDGLSEQEARDIARFLAGHPAATAGALGDYGATGTVAHAHVIRELFDLYVAGDDETHPLVRALGSHLIWQATKAEMTHGSATSDVPRRHGMLGPANFRVLLGLEAHDHAFVAYLQLHDVDPHDKTLLRGFHDAYLGSYHTMPELLQAFRTVLVDSGELDGRNPAVLSDENLMEFAGRSWDIVELQGKLYVFSK